MRTLNRESVEIRAAAGQNRISIHFGKQKLTASRSTSAFRSALGVWQRPALTSVTVINHSLTTGETPRVFDTRVDSRASILPLGILRVDRSTADICPPGACGPRTGQLVCNRHTPTIASVANCANLI